MHSKISITTLSKALFPRLQYVPVVARSLYRKHVGVKKDLRRNDGLAMKPPHLISIRITNRCNQRCAICGQFGKHGYMHTEKGKNLLNEISLDDYKKVVDEMARYKPYFYITGGEAFLYKDLFKLTEYIKQKKCYVYVITNGTLLEEHASEIVGQRWDMLTSSLDGPESIHDQCRGVPGTFRKTFRGCRMLLEERKKQKRSTPYFILSATVSEANQHHLEEMFETAAEIKPDCLILYLSWFTTEKAGRRHADILKKELGVDATTWQSYIGQNSNIDVRGLTATLETLEKKRYPFAWFHIPGIPANQFDAYYNQVDNFLKFGPCVAPYMMVDIMPNGDVTTCRDYIDVKTGNIIQKPLLEIWNDEPFRKFRSLLKKHGGVLPQCSRCCGLMGF